MSPSPTERYVDRVRALSEQTAQADDDVARRLVGRFAVDDEPLLEGNA